ALPGCGYAARAAGPRVRNRRYRISSSCPVKLLKLLHLKQSHLLARPAELGSVEFPAFCVETILLRIALVLLRYQIGDVPFTAHPNAPAAVVDLAVVTVFDEMPDLVRLVGKCFIEPVVKDELYGSVKPNEGVSTKRRAIHRGSLHDPLHLVFVETGDHRPQHHAHTDTGV